MDAREALVLACGDVEEPVFLRSSAKPFIAAAALAAGARERFGLEPREIAVMSASHTGQAFHVAAVRSILAKIGLPESALQCGVHAPYNEEAAKALVQANAQPSAVHNNCSGKHAGILALCLCIGADPATYLSAENPAQQQILALCARLSGERVENLALGVDGCGIPVYAVSLRSAARSFMHLATLRGIADADAIALQVVREAMAAHPEYVSGTGELDTRFMQSASGRLACKGGAEGVHGAAFIEEGVGIVLKVLDGASRARSAAALAAARHLGLLSPQSSEELADLARPVVYNRAGAAVGEIRAKIV